MFRKKLPYLTGILFLIADQAIKLFLTRFLKPNDTIPVIKNIFHITLVFNTGCAFGMLKGLSNLFFILISFVAVIFLVYFLNRARGRRLLELAAMLVLSGAASNLIDRLRFGYIVDFLDFRIWPVFNLGDTAITIGVAILIFRLILRPKPNNPVTQ